MFQGKISCVNKEKATGMFFWKQELYIAKTKAVPIGVLESLGFYVQFLWSKHLWYHKNCVMNVPSSNTPWGVLHSLPITAFVSADNSPTSLLRKQNCYRSSMFIRSGWSWRTSVAWLIQTYLGILLVIAHRWELMTAGIFYVLCIMPDNILIFTETLYLLL